MKTTTMVKTTTANNDWNAPRIWPDSTVYIIGGGFSLKGVDLTGIHDKRVIGCNNAYGDPIEPDKPNPRLKEGLARTYKPRSWVDVCWFGDSRWWEWHKYNMVEFPGLKVCCVERLRVRADVKVLHRSSKSKGIEGRTNYVSWNGNTGGSAINLAVHFGAKKIVLLGFDMRLTDDGRESYHNDHLVKGSRKDPYVRYLERFPVIAQDAKKLGVEIVNATPDSAITCFPVVRFEDTI